MAEQVMALQAMVTALQRHLETLRRPRKGFMKSAASVPNPMPSEFTAEARVAFKRLASLLAFWCEDLALDVVVEAGTDPSEGLEAWRRLIADYDTRMASQLSGTLVAAQGAEAAQGSGGGEFDGGAGLVPTDVRSSEGKRRNGRRYAKNPWKETRFCYHCGKTGTSTRGAGVQEEATIGATTHARVVVNKDIGQRNVRGRCAR